jgi:hypothetical protein
VNASLVPGGAGEARIADLVEGWAREVAAARMAAREAARVRLAGDVVVAAVAARLCA